MGVNEKSNMDSLSYGTRRGATIRVNATSGLSGNDVSEDDRSNEIPNIVPCYNGKTLKIHEELVVNGLSAISIKHPKGNCSNLNISNGGAEEANLDVDKKTNCMRGRKENESGNAIHKTGFVKQDLPDCLKETMKHRNSFWNLHRPELSKLTWPQNYVSSAALQDFFHHHLKTHGTFCEPLHECTNLSSIMNEEMRDYSRLRELVPPRILPADEKSVTIVEKTRSLQLNDEDLDPETVVHKSRAEFCVTIGEYLNTFKRSLSQQTIKCPMQSTGRLVSLPLQHEGLLSKDNVNNSEEKISSVIGGQNASTNIDNEPPLNQSNGSGALSGKFMGMTVWLASSYSVGPTRYVDEQKAEDGKDESHLRIIVSPKEQVTSGRAGTPT